MGWLAPEQASTVAPQVDALFLFFVAVCGAITLAVTVVVIYFAIKYRRLHPDEIPEPETGSHGLEVFVLAGTLVGFLGMFFWGASVFFTIARPPPGAMDIYVVGRQWMWKFQHLDGHREINELHVPIDRPVRLIMASEDVIHSFFVPAFRVKNDVIPGRYSTLWFQATKPGTYHLFCAEYCGTKHAQMIGRVVAMEPADYQAWLGGGAGEGSLASAGERLYQSLGCASCHSPAAGVQARGPDLAGVFGKEVELRDGRKVAVDEAYLRESILTPNAKVVAGFEPIMPTYEGQLSEDALVQLVAYIKSLGAKEQTR